MKGLFFHANKRILAILFLFVFASGFLLARGEPENDMEAASSSEKAVLRLSGGDWGLPSPYRHYRRGPGIFKMHLIYDSLLEIDENGYIPWLATSWKVSGDGLTYTFALQEGVLWHDRETMSAEDVAFTFNYYREHPPVYSSLFPQGNYIVQDCRVVDEQHVAITVNSRDVTYLSKLGEARIIPRHIWEEVDDPTAFTGAGATIGCGPFTLDSYNSEEGTYRFAAFEDYWGLDQAVSAIEFIPVSDAVLAFENSEVAELSASADLLSRYESNDEFTVAQKPSYHCYRLALNMIERPELLDVKLRKALAYGIDREEILEKVQRGSGVVSSMGYVWEDSSWYNPNIEQYEYNPHRARELLGGETYSFTLLTGNSAEDIKTAELIKLDLEEIGIDITVKSVESKVRDTALQAKQYELLLVFYGGMGGDPDFLRSTYYVDTSKGAAPATYFPGYSNDRINHLAQAQAIEFDPQKRKTIIYQLQDVIASEVPMVLITGTLWNIVYRPGVYDNWVFRYGHNMPSHNKLSYLIRK